MTEAAPDRLLSGKQLTKLTAGTLAAVSAAAIGSFLGVAGTLVGAAVASVVASLGTEIYQRSLTRGTEKLQTLAPAFIKAPAAVGTPEVAAASEEDDPSHTVADAEVVEKRKPHLRWKPIVIGAAAVFIIAMGAVFAVEAFAGRSLSSITTGTDSGRSTIGVPVGNTGSSPSPSVTPTPSQEPSGTPSTTPSTEAPATDTTVSPTDTGTPADTPTTDIAPEPTSTGGAEQNQQQQPTQGTEEEE
jgi:hypothetical protein